MIGAPDRFGEIRINLNAGGNFTGKLSFGGVVYPLRGVFAGASAAINLQRAGHSPLHLTLERIPASDGNAASITGTLEDDRFSVEFRLDRSARTTPAQTAGTYTIALAATSVVAKAGTAVKPEEFPQAPGFALLNLTEHGSALIVGELGDGTRFSAGARLAHDGTLPLFVPCYSGGWNARGLSGTIRFADLSDSDCTGDLSWQRPAQSHGSYRAGFAGNVLLAGSRFISEADLPMREVEIRLTAARLEIVRKRATLAANGIFAITPAGSDQMELFLNTRNGLLAGRFKHPATNQMTSIAGVVLQKSKSGTGLFRARSQPGALSINPR